MRAAKVDRNQAEIVRALRKVGAGVQSLAELGCGVPDLLVAFRGQLVLMEIKDWRQPPSKRKLTKDQKRWHAAWPVPVPIVETVNEALKAIGAIQ